jgi:hypothetical protein
MMGAVLTKGAANGRNKKMENRRAGGLILLTQEKENDS